MLRQAQRERGGVLHRLQCHPGTPARGVSAVEVEVRDGRSRLALTYIVSGADALAVPEQRPFGRADGLWRATCFELFWQTVDASDYVELNLSPSGQWAVYRFTSYRSGMTDLPMIAAPSITQRAKDSRRSFNVELDLSPLPPRPALIGLSAVIEEIGGPTSYWALAHPADRPDFHHPSCFLLHLPAAD